MINVKHQEKKEMKAISHIKISLVQSPPGYTVNIKQRYPSTDKEF